MATPEQVTQVRRLAAYSATDPYDDPQLSAMIDASGVNRVVSDLWSEKAAGYAGLVNVSESGSSRNMSDLHKNALEMAKHYGALADAEVVDLTQFARTRAIVREEA